MIRLVDNDLSGAELRRICSADDICACRIGSLFESYGRHESLARFWTGRDENDNAFATALYCSNACIYCTGSVISDEIADFINVLSPKTIFSRQDTCLSGSTQLSLMSLKGKRTPPITSQAEIFSGYCDVPTREIYALLQSCRCEDIGDIPYNDFASELLHFQRFGNPFCSIVRDGGAVVSFAMVQFITRSCAVIGAVCTAPGSRRMGYGSLCVSALTNALQDRTIYIVRNPDRNRSFYRNLGFSDDGSVYSAIP